MPEVGGHYIGAKILLPREDEMARDHVVALSLNSSGNVMGRPHKLQILDTQGYRVNHQYHCCIVQCDADRNEYLLINVLVDCHKDIKAISLTDQQTTV